MDVSFSHSSQDLTSQTPLMRQYWEIKNSHPDKIVLFRMGDFYEMFHRDAEIAAPILGIALTVRNRKSQDDTKMCGVPYHSVATPICKLLAAGYKVALCEQMEETPAKGLVRRAVNRILTPGMVYDPSTLDQLRGHFMSSYDEHTVSFLETTTGEAFYYTVGSREERERLWTLLQPQELVLTSQQRSRFKNSDVHFSFHLSIWDEVLNPDSSIPTCPSDSAARLMSYAFHLQGTEFASTVSCWQVKHLDRTLKLTALALRHLEILETYRGERRGSLLHAIDRTQSAAGARLLKSWLQFPLMNLEQIQARQEQIQFWIQHSAELKSVRLAMATMGDIERRLGKISHPNCHGRDLLALAQSLRAGLSVSPLLELAGMKSESFKIAQMVAQEIETKIVEDPPYQIKQGGIFRSGIDQALDELIQLTEHGQTLLAEFEIRERESTGIPSLKARSNHIFGYYIEVTKTHSLKVPAHYQRKQTLTQAERYTTPELSSLEQKIVSAQGRRFELEYELFMSLRKKILKTSVDLVNLARQWSELDVLTSLAWLAIEEKYTCPTFGASLSLVASRHPIVEQEQSHRFVPNNVNLKTGECLLLTGPNMAGKSTLMRQVAVTALMAQIGSYVPAEQATLPLFDRIFTRIGASDDLAEGLSTFMVEMKEVSEVVSHATAKSLVILDEIGRGTSTYDGLSLAQAILEYLLLEKKPMMFFATHYHELATMTSRYPQIHSGHMAIRESGGEIQFLHTLVSGSANKSYGIHVARLAGLPSSVTKRARQLLAQHESGLPGQDGQLALQPVSCFLSEGEPSPRHHELLDQIEALSLQQITPLEALNQIALWQQSLKNLSSG